MNSTANTNFYQEREFVCNSLMKVFVHICQSENFSEQTKRDAQSALTDVVSIMVRGTPPTTPFDKAREDRDFQRIKAKLVKKPRKNSKLWRESVPH